MKKMISILLLCLLLVCCLPLGTLQAGATEYEDGNWVYTVSNGKATVVKYHYVGGDITIPSKLGGYSVTAIGARSFENAGSVLAVKIPDSVVTIEEYAFSGCSLTGVTIGNGVTEIKQFAFYNCPKLRTVTLGNSVGIIEGDVFSGCEKLTTINFPEKLTHIYQNAFSGCKSLKKLTLPDNVKYIGKSAFSQCTGLTEITLGTGITTIYASGFADCTSLKILRVSNNLLTVEANAFKNCSALKNVYHTGDEAKMQKLRQNVKSTGNEYLKNATWNHVCAFANVDGKTPTCTETGKFS
ncbi:MAG: leucine-rich repeat domain-containing protein, partial [Oscillospiraceae bacterium]|nr:leucine-rich repeat domain-containing protein [Oscillospiraceae bacterium]